MRRSTRFLTAMVGVVLLTAGAPEARTAKSAVSSCAPCVLSGCIGGACQHTFRSPPCSAWPYLDCINCFSGAGCHYSTYQFGDCFSSDPDYEPVPHQACGGGAITSADSLTVLELLAKSGDAVQLTMLDAAHDNVTIDELRGAVNVRDCNNKLVAHYPILSGAAKLEE